MADLQALVDDFATELEAGRDPDPAEWLLRVEGEERQQLAELIDRYLMTAPRRAWDPVAYEASLAKVAVDQVYESIEGVSGSWPELLPRLRSRAKVMRGELVERLAAALGVGTEPAQLAKVGSYYHRMEHGLLPAEGVSPRVIEALAGIVGASAEVIRGAGLAQEGRGPLDDLQVFARVASLDPGYAAGPPGEDIQELRGESGEPARDAIDELFTGG